MICFLDLIMTGPLCRAEVLGLMLFIPWLVCGQFGTSTNSVDNKTFGPIKDKLSTQPTTSLVEQTASLSKPTSTSSPPLLRMKCYPERMVCGGLIIACTFFLMTTVLLTCKVCRLSRRIRKLSRDFEQNSDFDVSEAKKGKIKSGSEAKETAVLMSDVTQTNQEADGAATEQGGGKAEETKEGDAPKSEQSSPPAATAGSSTSSEPQEEASTSETTPADAAAAAPSSKATEEPKNQP